MNKCMIIGNLTRDPELRQTDTGIPVCTITVAVNRKKSANSNQPEADYFRVTAWRVLGENCSKYLAKGKKVAVYGPVTARAYIGNDGSAHAALEMVADEIEFLTPKGDGFTETSTDELPEQFR